jgi:hypothetical protein
MKRSASNHPPKLTPRIHDRVLVDDDDEVEVEEEENPMVEE